MTARNLVKEHASSLANDDFSKRWSGVLSVIKNFPVHKKIDGKKIETLEKTYSFSVEIKPSDLKYSGDHPTPEEFRLVDTRFVVVFEEIVGHYYEELAKLSKQFGISILAEQQLQATAVECLAKSALLILSQNEWVTPLTGGHVAIKECKKYINFRSDLKPIGDNNKGSVHYQPKIFINIDTDIKFSVGFTEASNNILKEIQNTVLNQAIANQAPVPPVKPDVKISGTEEFDPTQNKGPTPWLKRIWKRLSNLRNS